MGKSLALFALLFSTNLVFATGPCAATLDAAAVDVVEGANRSGFNLFPLIYNEAVSRDKNILFSSLGLSLALHMALNAATGPALIELRQYMGVANVPLEEVNEGFKQLYASLGDLPGKEKLSIANSAWGDQSNFVFSPDFKIPAEFHSLDFADPGSVEKINQWAFDKTGGMIPSIVASLPPDALVVLANAIFFQAPWLDSFRNEGPQKFTDRDGTVTQPPAMRSRSAIRPYLNTDSFQIVTLEFGADAGQGTEKSRFALDILLPKRFYSTTDSIDHTARLAFARSHKAIVEQMRPQSVDLTVPKFKVSFGQNLVQALRTAGLRYIFDKQLNNFAGMGQSLNGQFLRLSSVLQKVAVEMDENGFKAAAATSTMFSYATSIRQPEVTMVVDRPFMFFMRDTLTGLVLFEGVITDPIR